MTAQTADNLPAARRRLDCAISALIDPKPIPIQRDNGTTTIEWLDSLYDQLCDAVAGQTGERSGGHSTTPIWADIIDTLNDIHKHITQWHPEWPLIDAMNPTPPAVLRLQAIAQRTWTVEDTQHVETIAATLEGFAANITAKLSPEPVIYLMAPAPQKGAAACTACGTDYVWRKDPSDNNKPKRQPALKVTKDGCHCQECKAAWEPGQLRMLAAALGYPLPQGVLE